MASKFIAVFLFLSAARALSSTFSIVSLQDTFNKTILPISTKFTPIQYNISVSSINPNEGQKIIVLDFPNILANAAQPFSGIFWGSALPNVTEVWLYVSEGVGILDEAANYSTACSNATTIFNSTLIFMNCLQLGFTSVLLDSGLISPNEDGVRIANSYLRFGDIRSFNGSGVLDDITTCVSATCQNTSTSTCGWDVTRDLAEAHDPKYNATEKLKRLYVGFNAYCDGQIAQPSSDVLGPGVLIASFTQIAAVSFFFLTSKFHRWARYLKVWYKKPWTWLDGKTHVPTPGPRADPNSKPSGPIRALARFFTAVESISVATYWFFNQKRVMETSNTYAEARATFSIAVTISFIDIIPVFLGQTVLQRSGRHWWYTTLLTTIAAVVAWVFIHTPFEPDYAAFWTNLKNNNPITQCGGNPSPNTYCGVYYAVNIYGRESFQPNISKAISIIDITGKLTDVAEFVVIWAPTFLFVDQLFIWVRGLRFWNGISQFCKRVFQWDKLSGPSQSGITKVSRLFVWVIWTAHQSLLVISLVPTFTNLLLIFYVFTPLAGGWSYGQLVAALIWAPLGLKVAYYTFFGVKKGVENRIGGQFQIQSKRDSDPFAAQTEKARSKQDTVKYVSVTDLRNEWEISLDDRYQNQKYANAQSHIHHAPRKPASYSPIPRENQNPSYTDHSMA